VGSTSTRGAGNVRNMGAEQRGGKPVGAAKRNVCLEGHYRSNGLGGERRSAGKSVLTHLGRICRNILWRRKKLALPPALTGTVGLRREKGVPVKIKNQVNGRRITKTIPGDLHESLGPQRQ